MEKIYAVTGLHCHSCVTKLAEMLNDVDGVESAIVTLDPPRARVVGSNVDSADIAAAIASAGDYSAALASDDSDVSPWPNESRSWWETYYPLMLIVTFLIIGCAILQLRSDSWQWMDYMSDFMAGFFLVFGFFKLLDLRGFADAYQTYDIIAAKSRAYAFAYPFIEVGLGVAYLIRFDMFLTNAVTLIAMLVGSAGVLRSLLQKRRIQCACLGTVFDLPMSTVTLVEDVGMAVMAAAMLVFVEAGLL